MNRRRVLYCALFIHVLYKSYSVIDIQPSRGHTVITNRCARSRPVALTKVVAARARSTNFLGLGTTAVVANNEHCTVRMSTYVQNMQQAALCCYPAQAPLNFAQF